MKLLPLHPPRLPTRAEAWPRVRLALQTALAAAGAYAVAMTLNLPQGYWAVVTAVLVVQSSVGASLGLAFDRLIATILGAGAGGLLLALFGERPLVVLVIVSLCTFVLAYLAAGRPSLRLAPVSAIIVILADLQNGTPLVSAANRVLEITIGALIALAVSLFVFPSRAGRGLAHKIGEMLPMLADHIGGSINYALGTVRSDDDYVALNAKIRTLANASDGLVNEARKEITGRVADHADPAALMRAFRRLWHTAIQIARAGRGPLPDAVKRILEPSLRTLRDQTQAAITEIATAYRTDGPLPDLTPVEQAQEGFRSAVASLRSSGATRGLSTDHVAQVFSLSFALDQISQNLHDLCDRYDDLHGEASRRVR